MEAIYGPEGIGSLSGEEQTKAFDVIKDLDLSDPEQLRAVAETLTNMGGNFEKIASQFTGTASRWAASAATLLEQLASSTKDTAKSIESSTSDMSKVFKYSEALEKAQALMDVNEGIQFDELFTFDKDLGGYIKTAKAFSLEMAEFQKTSYDAVQQSITDNQTILPQIDSVNNTIRDQYLTDIKNESITGDRSRYAKQQFEQRLKAVQPEASDADLDRLWSEYTAMVDAFEAQSEDEKEDWNTFTQKYLQERGSDLVDQLEEIQKMPQRMAKEALQSFDFASIASGKGTAQSKETFKALLTQATSGRLSEQASGDLFDLLLKGEVARFNSMMHSLGLDDLQVDKGQANRARFEGLTSLYQKIASGDVVWDALTKQEQELLNSVEGVNLTEGASTAQVGAAADNVWAAIVKLIDAGAGTLNEVADTIAGKADKAFKDSNAGKQYNLLTSYKDGFTSSEAQELGLLNDDGTLKTEFASYLERDSNGNWIAKAGQDAASVIQELARLLGISIDKTTDEYKDAIEEGVNQAIADADEADIGKQRVNAWQSVMSGKVTDRIGLANVDATTKSYMKAAGLIADINDKFVYIESEQQLNNAIEWMRDKLADTTFVQGNKQTARYFQQLVSEFEAKTAKKAAFEGIVGEQFDQSAAEALSMALQNTTEYSDVQSLMTEMGFKWDQAAQIWKASVESIKAAKSKIMQAFAANEIDAETYTSLIASLNETANAINPKTKQDNTILDMLQNYANATEAMKAAFITNFDPSIYTYNINKLFKANDNGTYDVDVAALKSFLDSIGFEYDEAAMSQIQAITDSYLSNIQTATTYTTQGASSLADVEAFKQSYKELVGTELSQDAFTYDTIQNSFVLGASYMQQYIEAQKQKLLSMGYAEDFVNTYVQDQTDNAIRESIALDGFLNAQGSKEKNDEASKLIQQIRGLSNYKNLFNTDTLAARFFQGGWSEAIAEQYDQLILETLESGGQAAVDLLEQIKSDASQEELEAAFNSQINKLNDVMSQVGDLVAGQFVGTEGKLYEVLARAGAVDDNGVVKASFDMVAVYAAIYAEMSKTAGATTAGLNDAYAQLLTAEDQRNIDITEALKNGNGMSYADFGSLLAKYDIKFEDYMAKHYDAVMRDGFGNIRITNWNAFAESIWGDNLDQVKNTREYTSAFKAYNDGLIELNKNAEQAIVDEIKQIENAKTGDWLNFSELWTKLENAWETIDFKTAVPNYNGNVSNMGHRVIVPGKIMDQYFGGHNGWGTIFGEDVAFKEFGETYANIGATFANLTEEGKKAPDIAAYAKELYTMAISRVGGDASKVTADLIKQIDAEEENLILNIKDFGDSVKPEEVLNALWEESDLYHKAEEQAYSATEVINASLQMYGASLEDGILKIGDNANLLGVAQVLQEASEMAGLEIGNGLEEVKDTVLNILKSYSDAIMKGIDGGLSNTEAADLQQKASDMGIKDLQFTQTKEGLKLSNESAKELYNTLKQIDALQGELVFSKLMDSLIATEDHFKTIQDTQAYINKLRSEIEAPNNAERLKSLQDELDLAEKINMTRSIETEDDSFKFMEGKIPDAQNNPLNYWKNWAKAFDAMKKAGKGSGAAKNTMGYEDFYNIISEMGRLADITGKGVQLGEHTLDNSKKAADLITQAAGALKNVNGELVVDLSGIKVDFTSGLADLGDQIDGQVDALADSQIHMLDAIIAVLEIIVAMEKLKDLDIDNDLTLDFSELGIEVNDDGSIKNVNENLKGTVNDLLNLEATLEDGTSVLDAVSIQSDKFNITMRDFLEHYRDVDWLNEKGITGDMYKTLFSNMLKLVASPDWLDAAKNGSNFFEMMNRYDWGDLVIGVNTPDVTLRMGGTGNLSIDWSNVYSEAYERAFEQEFNEQVKADLQKALDTQSSTDTGLTAETNTKLKILNHTVVEVTDEKGNKTGEYTIAGHPGKKYSDKTLAAAVAELYEQGATEIDDTQWVDEQKVKGKIKVGSAEFELESNGGDAKYTFKGQTGKNATETFNKFISTLENKDKSGLFDKDGAINQESARYKELQVQYGLSLTPIITYTTSDGKTKEGNVNKNTVLRDAVNDYLETGETEDIKVGDKATTVTLAGGIKATIPNDQLEFEIDESGNPQVTADSLKSYFNNLVGLDLGLKDTISSAIKDALSGITEQLNSLDPGKLSEVASALAEIAAALADIASQDIEKQIEQIKELQSADENQGTELNIPENIDESEFESALTRIIHEAAEAVANDNTFKEITGKIGESGGQTLVDKFGKELSNMAEQVQPQLTAAASSLSSKASIMGEAGKQLGEAIVKGIQEGMTGNVQTISSAIDAIASSIKTSLIPVLTQVKDLSKQEFNFDLGPDTENTAEVVATILETLGGITELRTQTIRIQAPGVDGVKNKLEALLSVLDAIAEKASIMINAEVGTASETPEESPKEKEETVSVKYETKGEPPEKIVDTMVDYIINIIQNGEITHIFDEAADYIIDIIQNGSIPSLHDQHATYVIDYVIRGATAGIKGIMAGLGNGGATGNFGLAKVKGTQTLMGELGPELVVSNGRYFVAGQNGAEMVNLDDDAIVFNHLQTEQLLKNGMSKGRGRAVTNERNAVAFATGNVEGPAMASASAALNALKQLRAMWESLKSASISDLAGAGGGGGGGGGDNAKIVDPSIWVDTVERWYNLMQKIAKLEKEITHEEKLRSKLSSDWTANGNHYYASQKRSLEALRDQIDAQEQLNLSREAYYDQRVEALQNQPFGKLIEFDNEGQMRFKEGAMDWLTNLVGFDQNGKANYTDEEKYNILMAAGYGDYMKYDSSGGEIKMDEDNNGEVTDEERQSFYGNATKAFWDKINDYKEATQSLWDSIKEGEDSILQLQADQNELLADIRENQMAVEDAVLDAIEDMRQREIDALQDERDKLEESTQKYIDGLSDALNREQEMYQNQEDENSLNQQKRRLAILQRSGGSAEDIANLRAEIDSSERERYFNLQQQQIDAIQRASDLEIERMDSQIELMTEALDYQKEYGLLWGNVYEVMDGTAQQITSFITNGNSEFWASSELATQKVINEQLFAAEQWTSYRDDLIAAKAGIDANTSGINANGATAKDIRDNVALMVTMTRRQLADTDYTIFDEAMKAEFGEDYDPNSAYKQLFYDDYMGHGDVTRATATARAKYAADKKAAEDAAAAAQAAAEAAIAAEETHGGEPEEDKGCPDCAVNCGGACYNACENGCSRVCKGNSQKNDPEIGNCNGNCQGTAKGHTGTNTMTGNAYTRRPAGKAAGGYVNHGIYELGERGTETVLTASQTRVLRENILSNRPNSLISLLKSYNEGYDGINNSVSGITPVEDNSTVIEKVELNMEVKQIANDYDARRAGEQALNEMMRIARKTGAANSIRR